MVRKFFNQGLCCCFNPPKCSTVVRGVTRRLTIARWWKSQIKFIEFAKTRNTGVETLPHRRQVLLWLFCFVLLSHLCLCAWTQRDTGVHKVDDVLIFLLVSIVAHGCSVGTNEMPLGNQSSLFPILSCQSPNGNSPLLLCCGKWNPFQIILA